MWGMTIIRLKRKTKKKRYKRFQLDRKDCIRCLRKKKRKQCPGGNMSATLLKSERKK